MVVAPVAETGETQELVDTSAVDVDLVRCTAVVLDGFEGRKFVGVRHERAVASR
jgi:hypothetical protein